VKNRIILAYSGGLDTSFSIKWIQEKYDAEVITMTADVGQGDDMKAVEEKALAIGALRHHALDVKDEFAGQYVYPAVKANALYEGRYPISTALARPLIASKLVEVARKENATGVAHGCTGKGNDQVRFDVTVKALAPDLKIVAPIREYNLNRAEELEYLRGKGVTLPFEVSKRYSVDQNLWGRSVEGSDLEDPMNEPQEDAFEWTKAPEKADDEAEYVSIEFERGVPCSVNERLMKPVALIDFLNKLGGRNGVGRIDHMEDRLVGIKSREVYECPAAVLTLEAHKDLEKTVLTRHESLFKERVDSDWAFLVYAGLWLEPLKKDLDSFIDSTQERVTGQVRLKLYKGGLRVVGRRSVYSLYDKNLATYGAGTTFDQSLARGFIELWGLPTIAANMVEKQREAL
jgi:argininosuccinate synthase